MPVKPEINHTSHKRARKKDTSVVDKWDGIWKGKKWATKIGKPSRRLPAL